MPKAKPSGTARERAKRGGAALRKARFYSVNSGPMSEAERRFRLLPKLINGRVVLSDGRPREIQYDPLSDQYVARFGPGEFWLLDHNFQPIERAPWQVAQRAGFHFPWSPDMGFEIPADGKPI